MTDHTRLETTVVGDNVAWISSDGHVSTSYKDSTRRQKENAFKQYYKRHLLNGVPDDRIVEWLRQHKEEVLALLEDTKSDII